MGITRRFSLLNERGERLPIHHWSSGLADQVYLALRLALAKVFSYQVDALPIILDDILVRFDENRQKSALELLADLVNINRFGCLRVSNKCIIWAKPYLASIHTYCNVHKFLFLKI